MNPLSDPRVRTLTLLRKWGWNATCFQVLERGFRHFFDGDDACIAYVDTGSAWVVAGAPIAPERRLLDVTNRFLQAAREAGRRACFVAVEHRFVVATGLPSLVVGEQGSWNPQHWDDALAHRRSVREQIRRARAKGVCVQRIDATEMSEGSQTRRVVEELVARWLKTRNMATMGFLVDVQPFEFAEERRYFAANVAGKMVGFLAAVPIFGRGGWLFEDLLRDPEAPNGTMEMLVDLGMRSVANEGSNYVTLGPVPLAGAVPPWLGRLRRWGSDFYDFEGLRAFKAKFAPQAWDPILLAHACGASPILALCDVSAAFTGETFFSFWMQNLLRAALLPTSRGSPRPDFATLLRSATSHVKWIRGLT